MKKIFICLSLLAMSTITFCQNLLNDGGLDGKLNCPQGCGQPNYRLSYCTNYWKSTTNWAGYLHYCGDTTNCLPRNWQGVPNNAFGHQYPLSDSGYASVHAGSGFGQVDNKGYVFQKMRQNTIIGQKYWVEFYTNLGDSANYAVKSMGASFRIDTIVSDAPFSSVFRRPFKMENQGEYITDKVNWTQLHWIYQADSIYQTFLMGYARFLGQWDTLYVGSECNWCDLDSKYSFYYLENAGIFPIISNNQTLQVCSFPQTLQGAVGNDIWFSQWGSDTNQANTLQIYGPGIYTQTWRTDTTVHIDTFFVEALLPQGNFFTNDTVPMAIGGSVVLNGPTGFAYLWSNNQISQSITIDIPGTYWLMITDESGCNRYDTVVVRYDTTVAELLQFKNQEFDIYPNPASEKISIKNNTKQANISLEIYSSNGQKILQTQLKNKTEIDVSEWNNGLYFAKIIAIDGSRLPLIKKFVVGK